LKHEGGFTIDHAGATNFGISERFAREIGLDINGDGKTDAEDIKLLTVDKAIAIYQKEFWDKYGYDKIDDWSIAAKVFDMAVNMGAKQAHRIVQRALNWCGFPCAIDGILGKITLSLINKAPQETLMKALCLFHEKFYLDIISKNVKYLKYKNGWLKRARWSGEYKL